MASICPNLVQLIPNPNRTLTECRCMLLSKGLSQTRSRRGLNLVHVLRTRYCVVNSGYHDAVGENSKDLGAIDDLEWDKADRAVQENRMITKTEAIAQKNIGFLIISCALAYFLVSMKVLIQH